MDIQSSFNIAVGLVAFLGGWVLHSLRDAIANLQKSDIALAEKVQHIEILVVGQYVKRDDLEKLSSALFVKLDKIDSKLDSKVDKI